MSESNDPNVTDGFTLSMVMLYLKARFSRSCGTAGGPTDIMRQISN